MWPDWPIYWSLGNLVKPLATINLPESPTFLGNFCKGVIFLVKSFLGNFYRHLATFFSGHTGLVADDCQCENSPATDTRNENFSSSRHR